MTTVEARRISVMVVEDHAFVRAAVCQALATPDVEVVGAVASAEEALQLAPAVHPDVLLVDIGLPGLDGVELVRELAPRLPGTSIVMLTVSRADGHLLDAMRYGAKGYLTKDLTPEGLLRAVRSVHDGELALSRATTTQLVSRLIEGRPRPAAAGDPMATLTGRELEVLRLLAEGLTDREIARALTLSPRTVATHVSSVLHKLRARNRSEAARRYREGR